MLLVSDELFGSEVKSNRIDQIKHDLVVIDVCHFHHHQVIVTQIWPLSRYSCLYLGSCIQEFLHLKVIWLFHIFSIWFLVEKLGRSCSWYSWCAHHFGQLYGQSYCRWLHSPQVYFVLQRPRWYRVGRQGLMSSRHLIKYETWIGKLISRKFGPLFENVTKCLWF